MTAFLENHGHSRRYPIVQIWKVNFASNPRVRDKHPAAENLNCRGFQIRCAQVPRQVLNLHLGSSSPFHSPSSDCSSCSARSSLCLLILRSSHHSVPTTAILPTKYANATLCPTMYLGPSFDRYSCVPITAPKFPIVICNPFAAARLVCPETFIAGQLNPRATEG